MRVFRPGQPNSTIHVTPGAFHDTSDWRDKNGKPITFQVVFTHGVASVDSQLGEYLIKDGHAQRTPLILPNLRRFLRAAG
jgi:hypothetical protein